MKKSDQPSRQRIVSFEEKDTPFADMGFSRKLPANTTFIQPGEMLRCCYYVKSGIVVAGELSENGVEHEFNIMEENSLIGEVFLFTNTPSPVSFRTVKDTELICIEWETMKDPLMPRGGMSLVNNSFLGLLRSRNSSFVSTRPPENATIVDQ